MATFPRAAASMHSGAIRNLRAASSSAGRIDYSSATDYLSKSWDTGQHALIKDLKLPAVMEEKICRGNARKIIPNA
jgi:hypothetical protein